MQLSYGLTADRVATPRSAQHSDHAVPRGKIRHLLLHISERNCFGVIRRFALPSGTRLTHDPNGVLSLRDFTDVPEPPQDPGSSKGALGPVMPSGYGPFTSKTAFSMADWYWHSTNKSFAEFQKLIDIMKQPDFSTDDAINVNWKAVFKSLGANKEDLNDYEGHWITDDGWKSTPIKIGVPFHNRMKNRGTESYTAGKLQHRSILSVIKEKIASTKDSSQFHYQPYRASWKPSDKSPEVDLYGEFYYSQEFRNAHEEVQKMAISGQDADLERVVVALMFWSDSSHLTQFGTAYIWPCYLFFGNESKYRRCKPSEGLGNHGVYFEKVSRFLVFGAFHWLMYHQSFQMFSLTI